MSQSIEIRRIHSLSRETRDEAVALFTAAFQDGALFAKAFPDPRKRAAVLRLLFTALVSDAVAFGGIHGAYCNGMIGALLWYPPGAYPMTTGRIFRQLHRFLLMAALSPRGVFELRDAQEAFDSRRPKQPHCHVSFLAGRAGERVSLPLAHALMSEVDDNNWPIYLETQNARSVPLYRRMGCEILGEPFECSAGGPPTWTMWRPPGAASHRLRRADDESPPLAAE